MNCPACGAENSANNRFCGACGAPQALICAECGSENPAANRFCGNCGTRFGALESAPSAEPPKPAPRDGERRQLTVMFCDLVGSTALSGRLDPEDLQEVMQAYQETSVAMIEQYGGHVAKYLGDGILAYFGYPTAHENDAERAVHAGLGITRGMAALNQRLAADKDVTLATRVGIGTGLVVVGEMGAGETHEAMAVVGETPNIAARLQELAKPNQVVIGPLTQHLTQRAFDVEAMGAHSLKGVAEPVGVYAVLGAKSNAQEEVVDTLPLVGRDTELSTLASAWQAARSGVGQVVLIGGEAGIGKSRILRAAHDLAAADDARWLEGFGSPYHTNTPLFPLVDLMEHALGFESGDDGALRWQKLCDAVAPLEADTPEITAVLGMLLALGAEGGAPSLTPRQLKERTEASVIAYLKALAAQQPLVIGVEDLHWIDASTIELLTRLTAEIAETPMLLVLSHRSEFMPPFGEDEHIHPIALDRLDRAGCAAMVSGITGGKELPDALLQQIVARTGGVPLFIEEITRMLLESKLLVDDGDSFALAGPLPERTIPATLQESLIARLDRLGEGKEMAQLGATIGRSFTFELIEAVSEDETRALISKLEQLAQVGLIQARGTPPNAIYSFRHGLMQEISYESLLKRRRQLYHRRIAEVLEGEFPEIANAQPELLAQHYTQAGADEKAVGLWQTAGRRAMARSANIEAIGHFRDGLALIERMPEGAARAKLEAAFWGALAPNYLVTKGYASDASGEAFEKAYSIGQSVADPALQFPVTWGITAYHFIKGDMTRALDLSQELIERAEASGNEGYEAFALASRGIVLFSAGAFEDSAAIIERGLALYDPERDRQLTDRFGQDVAVLGTAYGGRDQWLLGRPDRALEMVAEAVELARHANHPFTLAVALCTGGGFAHLLRGEVEQTRHLAEETIAIASEHRFPYLEARGLIQRGWCLSREGALEAGIGEIEAGIAAFRATGALTTVPFGQAILAEALCQAGRIEAARTVVADALDHVARLGERDSEAELHRIEGMLHHASGDGAAAEQAFRRALEIARAQKALSWELRAATGLAGLLIERGESGPARATLAPVLAQFTEGLQTADLLAARALLDGLPE